MAELRVVVATPLSDELVEMIRTREPRLEVVHEPRLMAPAEPNWIVEHERTVEEQAEYERLVDTAEALYGVPDQSGKALARTVAANPNLRWVHTIPAGGGQQVRAAGLPEEALQRILFTTSGGVHAQPLAEFSVFGVMAGAKQLPWMQEQQRAHHWAERRPFALLTETTVAVVGLGGIGRRVAEILKGLGCTVVGVHRRHVDAAVDRIEPVEALGDVFASVDAVVVALPGTAVTEGIISREVLARTKPGLTFVNVGRGTTVDEPALIEALQDGRVGLAVLDVTAVEPLPEDSPLWVLPNVVLAPHTAAISQHEPRLIAELFVENARRFLDGEELKNRVNTAEFY
ncbi:MAG: D-2-hydroxyacid dehydrogenase [Actinomycetota bacterium]|nr:D-2-hydroxyacid dehydrogenase [Actinomycetota bacterium]